MVTTDDAPYAGDPSREESREEGLLTAMSDDPEPSAESDEAESVGARRHALWGLSVLVLLAVLVIAVTLFFSGTPGGHHGNPIDLGIPTPGPTPTQSVTPTVTQTVATSTQAARSSAPARHPATRIRRRTATAVATPTPPGTVGAPAPTRPAGDTAVPVAPCAGSMPCTVAGDGGIGAALNAARRARGAGAAQVAITPVAQRCAASGGAQCPGQYAIQTTPAQNGRQAVAALASSPDNGWLFDPATVALQAGWAYLPDLHEYVVALLAQ